MKVEIRNANIGDLNSILDVEKKVWGKGAATKKMVESRLKVFPEGNKVAIVGTKIVGIVFTEIIGAKKYKNWYDYTDNGCIRKSHHFKGDTVFGVGLSVLKEYSNKGIGTSLLLSIGQMIIQRGLKGGILGGRIPYYYKYKSNVPVEDYIELRDNNGKIVDPEIRFYKKAGFAIKEIVPDYFEDKASDNYGLLIEWKNPFYSVKSNFGRNLGAQVFTIIFRLKNKLNQ